MEKVKVKREYIRFGIVGGKKECQVVGYFEILDYLKVKIIWIFVYGYLEC